MIDRWNLVKEQLPGNFKSEAVEKLLEEPYRPPPFPQRKFWRIEINHSTIESFNTWKIPLLKCHTLWETEGPLFYKRLLSLESFVDVYTKINGGKGRFPRTEPSRRRKKRKRKENWFGIPFKLRIKNGKVSFWNYLTRLYIFCGLINSSGNRYSLCIWEGKNSRFQGKIFDFFFFISEKHVLALSKYLGRPGIFFFVRPELGSPHLSTAKFRV